MTSWVRLWSDMPTDPKWRVIARKSGQRVGDVIAIFNFMMVYAATNATERGRTQTNNCEEIACALDMGEADVRAVYDAMTGKVMDANGNLLGWEKRQPKREDNSAERAKAWRSERNRTQPNATERPEQSRAEQIIEPDKSGSSRAKGTRLSENWKLDENCRTYAQNEGLSQMEIDREADKFRDWWIAKSGRDATKVDWSATWRTWVRNSRDGSRSRLAGRPSFPAGNRPQVEDMASILARRRADRGD